MSALSSLGSLGLLSFLKVSLFFPSVFTVCFPSFSLLVFLLQYLDVISPDSFF